MIKHFSHILFLLPFVVFTQQKEVLHQEYFKNGMLHHQWYTLHHLPTKYWKTFYKDSTNYYQRNYRSPGKITSEGWYKNNVKNGYNLEYFKDSCIAKGYYIDDLKEKTWKFSTHNRLDSVGDYHLNKPTNNWLYYKKGYLFLQKRYLNNSQNYTAKYYYKNGTLESEGIYQNHQKQKYWKYYSDQHILKSCGTFKDGLKEGYWHFYSNEGILLAQGDFIKDKKSKWWSFFKKNGILSHKCELKKDKQNGYCVYYDKNKIVKGSYFKEGIKVKEWNTWSSFRKDYKKLND
ncbi:antitoxin component YwqK of YwqJK toxin-antitoxin module [Wenyingzhuangia heitensis]|uniref:Antitoxin component YwqK of YwqJK toxin-antitoxin module n=1 Tax=Wenyingzhuangia heitensis TaxID=1487859 RepID=A0ABX0UBF4_9FLAO|nr:hypothetical protein [Wenyingzhuangia heitensis]NIJ44491.1 antitoxin component YwqK of YwqJK toxin-antitoxin module [Wenyingzhuangia heitensis]